MQVTINISLKEGVLDPEGRAVETSLQSLGFHEASKVRIGKQITLSIDAEDAARAQQRAARMCESLLTNTVIEDYSIEVIEDE
ncbi:MAG: phosphoribosylformylglycinamidine synthase subunit PurS [Alphaproteobacteria bacterium]|jgi:phosphoribosylformylglycinamidine synthase|tara:strand:- start:275 stop:523 length:249 start_codon:yes stop_codon:yes gene_type:complete